jgi:hypothetical protein
MKIYIYDLFITTFKCIKLLGNNIINKLKAKYTLYLLLCVKHDQIFDNKLLKNLLFFYQGSVKTEIDFNKLINYFD